ncbi:MAG: glycine cleavage system aminomethyltransferase GcvT [Endomicrobium sp.]|jgi:aminomethyltransferase|nr:glycine cleavage system aminomethyltransferase GcvT [Endomicrobium sp.]
MKQTPLYSFHKELGAKFVEFSGWSMPIQYSSIIEEHNAVRTNVGVFDTSHMGTFIVSGKDSEKFISSVTLGNIVGLSDNKARYSMILNEYGCVKDDVIIYNIGDKYMIVVNAGNLNKDFDWLNDHKVGDVQIDDISNEICLIALQGPKAEKVLKCLTETDIEGLKYFTISKLKLKFKTTEITFCYVARTGYTGEDGFEIFISKGQAESLFKKLIDMSVKPCGLGCRDTLRLEACMPLHGHEISEDINPLEAGFQKTINWDNNFIGKKTLLQIKDNPLRKLVAFECLSGIARNSNDVVLYGKKIGYVTSGSFSPTLKKAIGLALIDSNVPSEELEVVLYNNSSRKIKIVPQPFYKKSVINKI